LPCKHVYVALIVRAKTAECAGCGGRSRHQDIVEVLASLGSGLYAGCPDGRLQVRGCVVSRNMITTVIVVVVIIVLVIVLLQFLR
jgi:hypothetical protein